MSRRRFIMITMCIFTFLCMFAVLSYAAEETEYSKGSLNYIILDDNTLKITKYHGEEKNYTIPSKIGGKSVSVIEFRAFMYADNLKKLVIPGSVKEIERGAIYGCYNLSSIVIEKGKLKTIYGTSIENCPSLKTVSLPKNVKTIGAFTECSGLEEINVDVSNPYICSVDGVVFSKDKTSRVF